MKLTCNVSDLRKKYTPLRMSMCFFGILFSGVACGLLKTAAFGVDPYQAALRGLVAMTGLTYNAVFLLISGSIFLFTLLLGRSFIGGGTVLTLSLSGYAVDFTVRATEMIFPDPGLVIRIMLFAGGILLLAISSAVYFTADMGISPYDSVSRIMTSRLHIADFKKTRIMTDGTCVALAILLLLKVHAPFREITGLIGAGTVIIAMFFGPLIEVFLRLMPNRLTSDGRGSRRLP